MKGSKDTLEIYVSPLGIVTLFIGGVIVSKDDLSGAKFKKVVINEWFRK